MTNGVVWRWRREGWFGVLLLVLWLASLVASMPWPRPGWRLRDWQRRSEWETPAVWRFAHGERVTGLFLVTQSGRESQPKPEMIFLAVYTPRMRFLDLLSLPWETQVELPRCLQWMQDPLWPLRLARGWPAVRRGGTTNGTAWDVAHGVLEARGLN
ncbi:MAG: hypothetical protein HYZ73_02255, partial [Elusimicrobia bacterium]|nr:hypothetical protein [Elusimicrobiota bacterium]